METNNLLIQPRPPRVVMAQNLLASPAGFDFLFPSADIVDFTELSQQAQAEAIAKYLNLYHCRDEHEKSEEDTWRLRRLPERSRRDYYLSALCSNDDTLTHKVLYSGNWDEQNYQTNLLIISNSNITKPAANVQMTDLYKVRYDYVIQSPVSTANFLVLPADILSDLAPRIRKKTVHGLARAMYLGNHDDLHGIGALAEGGFRAGTAALFKAMPEEFRTAVVQHAADCLENLCEYVLYDHQYFKRSANDREQLAFWRGAFMYVMQYLFDFRDPLLRPFIEKLSWSQRENSHQKLSDIWEQLKNDRPHHIHTNSSQVPALELLKGTVQNMGTVDRPITRISAFLPCRQPNGETIFMPPPATRSQIRQTVEPQSD